MSSSAAKRKQEDRLTQTLRELAAQPANKCCCDCAQRGPTYVNMTIGSFCCTGCSGILRGLNPPHRVKSISMATFTPEEVEFVKTRGNAFCRKVWMGLYDGDKPFAVENGFKDESQMKDHLIQKYEKKRWFVSPTEVARQQAIFDKVSGDKEATAAPAAAPPAAPVSNGSKLQISRPTPPSTVIPPASAMSLIDTSVAPQGNSHPQSFGSHSGSNVGGLSASVSAGRVGNNDGFADFAAAFNGGMSPPSVAPIHINSNFVPKSQTVPGNLHHQNHFAAPVSSTLMPTTNELVATQPHVSQPVAQMSAGDKYSALADLDEMFKVVTPSSNGHSGGAAPVKVPLEHKAIDQTVGSFGANPFANQPAQPHLAAFPPTTSHQQWGGPQPQQFSGPQPQQFSGPQPQQFSGPQPQQFGYRPPGPNPFSGGPPPNQSAFGQVQPNPFGGQVRMGMPTYSASANAGWGHQGGFPQQFGAAPPVGQMFTQPHMGQPTLGSDGKSWNPFL